MSGLYANYRLPGNGNHLVDYPLQQHEDERDEKECPDCGEEMVLRDSGWVCVSCGEDEENNA